MKKFTLTAILTALLIATPAIAQIATVDANASGLSFNTKAGFASYVLNVNAPGGQVYSYTFKGETPNFSGLTPRGEQMADGSYTYELVAMPGPRGRDAGAASMERQSIIGGFAIAGGQIIAGGADETPLLKDQVFLDDLIVDGSACVGLDCANGENFGFDTFRLKENNLRIHFDDSSSTGSFPSNDWRLTANGSNNGDASFFSIDDATANTKPLYIAAGAGNNALYIADTGNIGVGTASPGSIELNITDGDSPTLRLAQDGSSGFQSQTWDLAGNETNFFIRDVTGGSKLAFKIRPGSDDNALVIDNDNNIGLGILNATQQLHLRRTDGTSQIYVQNTGSGGSATDLLNLESDGPARFVLTNTVNDTWQFNSAADGLRISDVEGTANTEFLLEPNGDLTTSGTVNGVSDRNRKKDFEQIDAQAVLAAVAEMPISEWTYKADDKGLRHMGPMAQDFYAAFGLGVDERHIALTDMSGVALAAIQGLNAELEEKNAELEDRVAALEAMIEKLAAE